MPESRPSLDNPFAPEPEAPLRPADELVGRALGPEAAEAVRELTGEKKGTPAPAEDWGDLAMSEAEEKEAKEKQEKTWGRKEYIEWAESFDLDADWVDGKFRFTPDGAEVESYLDLTGLPIKSLPRGLKRVGGQLSLWDTDLVSLESLPAYVGGDLLLMGAPISSLKGLPAYIGGDLRLDGRFHIADLDELVKCSIGGDLNLSDIGAQSIPAGVGIKGKIIVEKWQTDLAEDAERKGYRVEVK